MGVPVLYAGSKYKPGVLVPIPPPPSNDPIGDALRASVSACYKLDSNGLDSKGHVDLTNNNSVQFVTGKFGGAAQFVSASLQNLYHANDSALSVGPNSFTICFWLWVDAFGDPANNVTIAAKGGENVFGDEYNVYIGPSGLEGLPWEIILQIQDGEVNYPTVFISDPNFDIAVLEVQTWYFCQAWYDANTHTMSGRINDKNIHSNSFVVPGQPHTTDGFYIGSYAAYAGTYLDGRVDEFQLYNGTVLSDEQFAYLYNSGAGRALFP